MTNLTPYIFGNLEGGYTQYPFDYAKEILSGLNGQSGATTMLATHRDGSLMYYCYVRKLTGEQYIGLCVMLNGVMFTNIMELFGVFENAITLMVASGNIIGFNAVGDLIATTDMFVGKERDIDNVFSLIKNELSRLENGLKKLPALSFSISKSETKTFSASDDEDDVAKASCKYGYTYVIKDKDYDTESLHGYRSVLAQLSAENHSLADKNNELEEECAKVKKQKKQFKNVVFLIFVVIACGIGIYALYENLNTTQSQLNSANYDNARKSEKIANLQGELSDWRGEYENLQQQYGVLEADFMSYKDTVIMYQPFLFLDDSFDFETSKYTFSYYGLTEGRKSLTIRVINPDGSVDDSTLDINISLGNNRETITFSRYFAYNSYYAFELIYDGKVIGGGRH